MPAHRTLAGGDTILTERSPLWCVMASGSLAALPVLLALLVVITLLLLASLREVGLNRLLLAGALAVLYACIVGMLTALLYRWPQGVSRWGDMIGGLLLWPASFPPVYALVATVRAFINGAQPVMWPGSLSTQWELEAIEAVSYAAVFASTWYTSWRLLYPRLLRRLSTVDERDVMAELLRRYYRYHGMTMHASLPTMAARDHATTETVPPLHDDRGSSDAS